VCFESDKFEANKYQRGNNQYLSKWRIAFFAHIIKNKGAVVSVEDTLRPRAALGSQPTEYIS